jgi:uncharacterized protein YqeY
MLIVQLQQEMLAARKSGDKARLSILSTLVGELLSNAKLENGAKTVADDAVLSLIKKYVKNLEELLRSAPSNEKAKLELDLLKVYLPQMLSEDELRAIIQERVDAGDGNIGKIMVYLRAEFNGKYDGKMASMIAKEVLG